MKTLIAALAVLLLQGCGTVHNTMRDGEDERVMLRGNDPVSYFPGAGPQKGDPAIKSVFEGDVYRFASDANKRLFDANPAQYAPAWAGFCASGVNRTTADSTFGGGRKAPGETLNSFFMAKRTCSITDSRP